jgi:kynureninase
VRQTTRLIELAEEAGFKVTSPRNSADRGGTITVGHEEAAALTKELIRREFIVDYRPGAGVRISPHFYTTDEELDLVISEMKKIADAGAYSVHESVGAAFYFIVISQWSVVSCTDHATGPLTQPLTTDN